MRYSLDQVPDDDQLLDDALSFAVALGALYRAHTKAPLPFEVPELVELEEAAEDAAGKKRLARGAALLIFVGVSRAAFAADHVQSSSVNHRPRDCGRFASDHEPACRGRGDSFPRRQLFVASVSPTFGRQYAWFLSSKKTG